MWETQFGSLGQKDPLEKEMTTHSRILAWEIPWTEEPDGLQSMGSQRVGQDTTEHARMMGITQGWEEEEKKQEGVGAGQAGWDEETRDEQFLLEAPAVTDREAEEPSAATGDDGTLWNPPQW